MTILHKTPVICICGHKDIIVIYIDCNLPEDLPIEIRMMPVNDKLAVTACPKCGECKLMPTKEY